MKQITIKLDDGTEVTAQVDESDFTKLNKVTTLSQNELYANVIVFFIKGANGI